MTAVCPQIWNSSLSSAESYMRFKSLLAEAAGAAFLPSTWWRRFARCSRANGSSWDA